MSTSENAARPPQPRPGGSEYGPAFWIALVIGWALIAVGIVQILENGKGSEGVWRIGGWFAGGLLVHDLLVAPLVAVVGVVLARRVGARWWPPVRAGIAATAIVLVISIPLLGGYGAKPNNNPSILPLDYEAAVLTVLGVVWGLVGVWLLVAVVAAARARRDRSS